mmetsp:Transcript_8891/g.32772  ORF Transcript_8891/g.32772 Transcript_8891/m.32772 type:complete len:549 (+) Transcript_8891:220-1866(+)
MHDCATLSVGGATNLASCQIPQLVLGNAALATPPRPQVQPNQIGSLPPVASGHNMKAQLEYYNQLMALQAATTSARSPAGGTRPATVVAPPVPSQVLMVSPGLQQPISGQPDKLTAGMQAASLAQRGNMQLQKAQKVREENSLLNQLKSQFQQQQLSQHLQGLQNLQMLQELQRATHKQLEQQAMQNLNPLLLAQFYMAQQNSLSVIPQAAAAGSSSAASHPLPASALAAAYSGLPHFSRPQSAFAAPPPKVDPKAFAFDKSRWLLTGEVSGGKRAREADAAKPQSDEKRLKIEAEKGAPIKPVAVRPSHQSGSGTSGQCPSPNSPLSLGKKDQVAVESKAKAKKLESHLVEDEDEDYVKLKIHVGSGGEESRIIGKKCKWWPKRLDLRFQDVTCLETLKENNAATLEALGEPTIRKDKSGKEKLKGIYRKPDGHYKADIQVFGRSVFLGNYARKELACQAHDRVALKMYGPKLANRWPIPVQRFHFHPKFYLPDTDYINDVEIEQLIRDIREDAKIWKLKGRYSSDTIKMYRSKSSVDGDQGVKAES